MAIQMRRGNGSNFDAAKMKSGEFAISTDTAQVWASPRNGEAVELAKKSDLDNIKPTGEPGVGIASVIQTTTSTESSGVNEITVRKTDGTTSTFEVRNGAQGGKGDKGDKGDVGAGLEILGTYSSVSDLIANHPTGNTGNAYLIDGNLYVWSENLQMWDDAGHIQGVPGKSAFDVAVDNGFEGTEEEWLESLKASAEEITVTALAAPLDATETGEGYGTCIVIHNSESCFVFDLGYDKITDQNSASKTLVNHLRNNGIDTITALFISHYHSDHVRLAAIQDIVNKGIHIEKLVLPHKNIDWSEVISTAQYGSLRDSIVSYANQNGINYIEPEQEGHALNYGDIVIKCYNIDAAPGTAANPGFMYDYYYNWPFDGYYRYNLSTGDTPAANGVPENHYNNFSMVNVVEFAGRKIVISADIMEAAQEKMANVLSSADLLFVPHHGLDTMLAHNLFNRMHPELAIINSAYDVNGMVVNCASRAFASELLRRGCRVITTYCPPSITDAADANKVVCKVSKGGVEVVKSGLPASPNIIGCAIKPGTDLDVLPPGEYIVNYEWQTSTIKNKPPFRKPTNKFRLSVETTAYSSLEFSHTAYNIDTSWEPEMARRLMVGSSLTSGTWHPWSVQVLTQDGKIKIPVSASGLNTIQFFDADNKRYCAIEGRASDHQVSFFIYPKDGGSNYRRYSLPAAPESLSANEYYTIAVK